MEEMEFDASQPVLLTPEGNARLRAELDHLTKVKRVEIAERLRDSKDHGEFSEDNSELDEVKQEQAIVENRIAELKSIFSNAEILAEDDIPTDHVGLGSLVKVSNEDQGFEFELRIVSSIEANPDNDQISDESPLGNALLGAEVGDVIAYEAPAGEIKYTVKSIRR
ncbi:MAG: transcription elongation factor GreA [Fimbriimonadaceae bacterium]|nr:transcription elongation factor GreA [Fimbriimonadaceae bacterium]